MKTLTQTYDYLCQRFDKIFKEVNPCEFKDGVCIARRDGFNNRYWKDKCCCPSKCKFYSPSKGCKTKNLMCKSYLCDTAYQKLIKNKKMYHSFKRLYYIAKKFEEWYMSNPRNEKYGSFYWKHDDFDKRSLSYTYFMGKRAMLNTLKILNNDEEQP